MWTYSVQRAPQRVRGQPTTESEVAGVAGPTIAEVDRCAELLERLCKGPGLAARQYPTHAAEMQRVIGTFDPKRATELVLEAAGEVDDEELRNAALNALGFLEETSDDRSLMGRRQKYASLVGTSDRTVTRREERGLWLVANEMLRNLYARQQEVANQASRERESFQRQASVEARTRHISGTYTPNSRLVNWDRNKRLWEACQQMAAVAVAHGADMDDKLLSELLAKPKVEKKLAKALADILHKELPD